jgi:hypothetical protein
MIELSSLVASVTLQYLSASSCLQVLPWDVLHQGVRLLLFLEDSRRSVELLLNLVSIVGAGAQVLGGNSHLFLLSARGITIA